MKALTIIAIGLVSLSLAVKGWIAVAELLRQRLLISRPEVTDEMSARYFDLVVLLLVEILLIYFFQSI